MHGRLCELGLLIDLIELTDIYLLIDLEDLIDLRTMELKSKQLSLRNFWGEKTEQPVRRP
jgi:hypothetical protein